MLRKIFFCALMLAALLLTGCGEEKVVGTPDKAILAYSEIVTRGESANMEAAGFSAEDNKNLRNMIMKTFAESFNSIVPLSDASADELAKTFYENNKAKMNFQAKVKTEDAERPIVELTTTPLDMNNASMTPEPDDELIALLGMIGKLKSDGATDEQLKENPEVQKLAIDAFGKYLVKLPIQEKKTCEIACKKVEGTDGKIHWAPDDVNALMDFIMTGKTNN